MNFSKSKSKSLTPSDSSHVLYLVLSGFFSFFFFFCLSFSSPLGFLPSSSVYISSVVRSVLKISSKFVAYIVLTHIKRRSGRKIRTRNSWMAGVFGIHYTITSCQHISKKIIIKLKQAMTSSHEYCIQHTLNYKPLVATSL